MSLALTQDTHTPDLRKGGILFYFFPLQKCEMQMLVTVVSVPHHLRCLPASTVSGCSFFFLKILLKQATFLMMIYTLFTFNFDDFGLFILHSFAKLFLHTDVVHVMNIILPFFHVKITLSGSVSFAWLRGNKIFYFRRILFY